MFVASQVDYWDRKHVLLGIKPRTPRPPNWGGKGKLKIGEEGEELEEDDMEIDVGHQMGRFGENRTIDTMDTEIVDVGLEDGATAQPSATAAMTGAGIEATTADDSDGSFIAIPSDHHHDDDVSNSDDGIERLVVEGDNGDNGSGKGRIEDDAAVTADMHHSTSNSDSDSNYESGSNYDPSSSDSGPVGHSKSNNTTTKMAESGPDRKHSAGAKDDATAADSTKALQPAKGERPKAARSVEVERSKTMPPVTALSEETPAAAAGDNQQAVPAVTPKGSSLIKATKATAVASTSSAASPVDAKCSALEQPQLAISTGETKLAAGPVGKSSSSSPTKQAPACSRRRAEDKPAVSPPLSVQSTMPSTSVKSALTGPKANAVPSPSATKLAPGMPPSAIDKGEAVTARPSTHASPSFANSTTEAGCTDKKEAKLKGGEGGSVDRPWAEKQAAVVDKHTSPVVASPPLATTNIAAVVPLSSSSPRAEPATKSTPASSSAGETVGK